MSSINARAEPTATPPPQLVDQSKAEANALRTPVEPLSTRVIRSTEPRVWPMLLALFLLGIAIRTWIVLTPNIGHDSDMGFFLRWAKNLHDHGIREFFSETGFCDYPPLWLLIMWAVSHITAVFDPSLANETVLHSALKVPACLADLLIAILLYIEGRRWLGKSRAVGVCALYFLNPLSIYNSAYWGQVDAIHTAFCLLSLVFVNRNRFGLAGAAVSIGLLQKFQSVAFVPLILFEIFRRKRIRGVVITTIFAIAAAAITTLPFTATGTLSEVLRRGYVNVIGQYTDLSRSAYNLWWLSGNPNVSDLSIPSPIVRLVANGRVSFPDNASWMLNVSWRTVSLVLYSLVVATILSLYALRPNVVGRYAAGGLLGLAFFLFPTEMHERYALPAIAFLAFWAVTGQWRERIFVSLSAMLLLNVAEFLTPNSISIPIAGVCLLLFVIVLSGLISSGRVTAGELPLSIPGDLSVPTSWIIRSFQGLTMCAILIAVGSSGWVLWQSRTSPLIQEEPNVTYLSSLKPKTATQGWKELRTDRSVGGSMIHLGSTLYQRGLGTHAKSTLIYEVPPGAESFEAIVGIDKITSGKGSAVIAIEVDGKPAAEFPPTTVTGSGEPLSVKINVKDAKRLTLRADEAGDGQKADHVDWALARFVMSAQSKSE